MLLFHHNTVVLPLLQLRGGKEAFLATWASGCLALASKYCGAGESLFHALGQGARGGRFSHLVFWSGHWSQHAHFVVWSVVAVSIVFDHIVWMGVLLHCELAPVLIRKVQQALHHPWLSAGVVQDGHGVWVWDGMTHQGGSKHSCQIGDVHLGV